MSKYKLVKETLWVARKPGCFTGYGTTPKKAFADAEKKAKKKKDNELQWSNYVDYCDKLSTEGLKHQKDVADSLARVNKDLEGQLGRNRAEIYNLKARIESDRVEGVVMMAMANFLTNDPEEAIKKARLHGLPLHEVTKGVIESVNKYRDRWYSVTNKPKILPYD